MYLSNGVKVYLGMCRFPLALVLVECFGILGGTKLRLALSLTGLYPIYKRGWRLDKFQKSSFMNVLKLIVDYIPTKPPKSYLDNIMLSGLSKFQFPSQINI